MGTYTGGTGKPHWEKDFTHTYEDQVKSAVYDYVAGYTTSVNDYLRRDRDSECKPVTQLMDKAFVEKSLIDVYRTVDLDYMNNIYGFTEDNAENFIGHTFMNKGYMSTTKIMKSPWGHNWMDDDVILHITSNTPYPCIDVNSIFKSNEIDCAEQEEVLLPRKTKLEVVSLEFIHRKQNKNVSKRGNWVITLNII